ncbi:MAG: D-glycero-beta-D-manno-heptose-7-phosphate kinase [Alphaproteobacteria bacterium]
MTTSLPEKSAIADAIETLTDASILCIGDLMLDRFVRGSVERISPEAPIPVLAVSSETELAGGAGNVVHNLSVLGASVHLIAATGDDAAGDTLSGLLADEPGLSLDLLRLAGRPTTVKTRFLTGAQQMLRADREATGPLDGDTQGAVMELVHTNLKGKGAVILSDYGKGFLSDRLIADIIAAAREAGIPVFVDPKGMDFNKYRGAAVTTPNRAELAFASGLPTGTDGEIEFAAHRIMDSCGIDNVLATRSEQGMTLVQEHQSLHITARAREVFDVAGAGDTVIAVMAAAVAAGCDYPMAAVLSNLAGGVVVGKTGTATVRRGELAAAVWAGETGQREKVVAADTAKARVDLWRKAGFRIGFTNGCFDLVHPGHVSLLEQARHQCDRLVVGLNSDASVMRLKGEGRPIQDQLSRSAVLGAMAAVDLVVVFDEDTPESLIRTLRPDVLVKGADYTVYTVVGAADVKSWGGEVFLASLVDGQSTTRMAGKISGRKT